LNGWTQSADLSAKDTANVSLDWALREFTAVDWDAELKLEASLMADGQENCPPGFGLVDPDGPRILHVCPRGGDEAMVFYHYPNPNRGGLFGAFKTPQLTEELRGAYADLAPALMELHFEARDQEFVERMRAMAAV